MCHEINKLVALNQIRLIGPAQLNWNLPWNQLVSGFEGIFNGLFSEKQSRNVL